MIRLPKTTVEAREIVEADGWVLVKIEGSHHQFRHPTKPGKVTIQHAYRKKPLHPKTAKNILRQAGLLP